MPFGSTMANVIRITGEAITLRKRGAATTNVTTQTITYAADSDTPWYGQITPYDIGNEGISTTAGELEVIGPKLVLDLAGVTPDIGDFIVREDGSELLILRVETQPRAMTYILQARS